MSDTQKNKKPNVPNLRFPGFEGEWEKLTLGEISEYRKERIATSDLSTEIYVSTENMLPGYGGIAPASNIPESNNVSAFYPGDILVSNIRPYLKKVWHARQHGGCSSDVLVIKPEKKVLDSFLYFNLANDSFITYAMTGAKGVKMPRGDKEQLMKYELALPSISEQKKIASLLLLIDQRIAIQNKVIEDLKKLKTAIGERIFKLVQGKQISLGDILNERNEKSIKNNQYEVLSSTVTGIYSQREYFNKDIASANNSGYKIVHQGDIVMSPQNLWMGNINYNDRFERGIVSPSYKVFSIRKAFDERYVAFLVKTKKALWEYSLVSEQGASIVRRNLNYESFLEISFQIPSYNEQKEVGEMIAAVNSKLLLEQKLLLSLSRQKSYFLSNIFI